MMIVINNQSWNVTGDPMTFEEIALYARTKIKNPNKILYRSKSGHLTGFIRKSSGGKTSPLTGMIFDVVQDAAP
jgi:hypothetical protein